MSVADLFWLFIGWLLAWNWPWHGLDDFFASLAATV
jgi:hypothetical protein